MSEKWVQWPSNRHRQKKSSFQQNLITLCLQLLDVVINKEWEWNLSSTKSYHYVLRRAFHCSTLHIIFVPFFVTNCFLLNSLIGLPTCLLCTCLRTTVYCDDHELDAVPPLPKKTMYFYSRYNRIRKINRNDFANLSMDSHTVGISFNFYYSSFILI